MLWRACEISSEILAFDACFLFLGTNSFCDRKWERLPVYTLMSGVRLEYNKEWMRRKLESDIYVVFS